MRVFPGYLGVLCKTRLPQTLNAIHSIDGWNSGEEVWKILRAGQAWPARVQPRHHC